MASNVTIKAIDSSAVHQIQAGQVIVDLCSVAKELVENSVDAGATNIEVRFRNQGLDSIEVQDNGAGIAPHNYESVALKHYTSKLSTYDDLSTLETFGFRGEALSSLCALSKFFIVTCTKEQVPRATKLEFEMSGKLKSTSVVSGQRGTSVIVEDLFRNLPVRRRELERNIKREWGKVISLLNQYACIQTGVKFTVSQQPTKGKRMILFSTRGNPTTRENIINVFGVKTMNALITMDLKLQLTPTAGPLVKGKARADGSSTEVRVLGHVSKPTAGEGRQTPDRQMFYVNGRPCGLPQFVKVFNEVYRSYNASQLPFIFADIQLDTHLYDVNVSPDKRTILLHDQGQMLDNLRESLIELFETQDVTIPVSQVQGLRQTPFKKPILARSQTLASGASVSKRRTATPSHQPSEPGSPITQRRPSVDLDDEAGEEIGEEGGDGKDREEVDIESASGSRRSATRTSPSAVAPPSIHSIAPWLERRPASRETSQISDRAPSESPGPEADDEPEDNAAEEDDENDLPSLQASRIRGFHADSQPVTQQPDEIQTSDHEMEDAEDQPPQPSIPAIPPPSQPPAPRSSPIAPARFKRTTEEVATITIGDSTVTSVVRSPLKRSRVDEPSRPSQKSGIAKSGKRTVPMPSFGGRLTRMFSAASNSKGGSTEDIEITIEEVDVEDEEIEGVDDAEEASHAGEPPQGQEDDNEDSLFVSQAEDNDVEMEEDEASPAYPKEEPSLATGESQNLPSVADSPRDSIEQEECCDHDSADDEYIDEEEKKAQEDQKVQALIDAAEAVAAETSQESEKRSQMLLKGRPKRKDMTLNLIHRVKTNEKEINQHITSLLKHLRTQQTKPAPSQDTDDEGLEAANPEEKLSLKITKTDFAKMHIIGQFNLGFILAVRSATSPADDDELFIIDQHASDEKYNFERLQSTTTVQSQRLVQPKPLTLTALEEEIIFENLPSLERNGFIVATDTSGDSPVGSRCQLLTLPLSRETTFDLSDLEELIFLLGDNPSSSATTIPRPSKVRKMFAMRACRSSIMIGRALSERHMERVVRHMGEMEKPWNCPHGRPTMRHLCGLGSSFEGKTWQEGEEKKPDWRGWLGQQRRTRKGKGRAE